MNEATAADYAALDTVSCGITFGELRSYMMQGFDLGRASAGGGNCIESSADALTDALVENNELKAEIAALKQQLADKGAECESCKEWEGEVMELKCRLADAQSREVASGAIVYEPDGEPRTAKKGEWYEVPRGEIWHCSTHTIDEVQVYKRRVVV